MPNSSQTIENEFLKLGIDSNGRITSLVNKKTGTEFLSGDAPTGWKLVTSLGRWREHQIFDRENNGTIKRDGDRVEIRFEGLTGEERARLEINLSLTFALNGEEVEARAAVGNRSKETVKEIWFPFLSGFRKLSAQSPDHL